MQHANHDLIASSLGLRLESLNILGVELTDAHDRHEDHEHDRDDDFSPLS